MSEKVEAVGTFELVQVKGKNGSFYSILNFIPVNTDVRIQLAMFDKADLAFLRIQKYVD